MNKLLIQGILIVALFFTVWYCLAKINWVNILKVERITNETQKKLGDIIWESYTKTEKLNKNTFVDTLINSLVNKICVSNSIDPQSIKVHIIIKEEVNAFALPNNHLILYTGLIAAAQNEEALCGVISHELAHIALNHVMKKLLKQLGISVISSISKGNGGAEIINQTVKILSSTAFDRSLEKEADIKAVDYLQNTLINPLPFADFLFNLSKTNNYSSQGVGNWVSTHPNPIERSTYIVAYSKNKQVQYETIFNNQTWQQLQKGVKEE